jgi:two-component system chemotaxis response regulator CheB
MEGDAGREDAADATAPGTLLVIGAAGMELRAVAELLRHLPSDLRAAIVVALHSIGAGQGLGVLEALSEAARLPCRYATDHERLASRTIYVAPRDRHILVQGDHLRVVFGPKENAHRPALDPLFRTAAHEWGSRTVAVVLCGLHGRIVDGLSGLWMVKENGGTVVVPHPAETGPIPTGAAPLFQRFAADYTPTPHELPALLSRLLQPAGHTS